ncbi:MAG: sialidase family protein [Pyrinomonadaceae bacterium]
MGTDNKRGRRSFLKASCGVAAAVAATAGGPGILADTRTERPTSTGGDPYRITLDLGYRAPRSGPITTLRNGDLLWITTDPEAPYLSKSMWSISRLTMRRSTDGGRSWSGGQVLQRGSKEYSVMSFGLRALRSGRLLHVFARSSGYDYETGSPERSLRLLFRQFSSDGGRTWTEAEKLDTGERYHGDVLSLEQLRDGRIVYPFCFLTKVRSQFAVSAMLSDDDGKTWFRSPSTLTTSGGGFESGASEPTAVELPDGRIWMLIRAQTGFLWESFSDDRGKTWSSAKETILPSSNAPATAFRLRDGQIAVAWNNHVHSNYARQSLVVGMTKDARSFSGLRELDFTDFTDDPAASIPHSTYSFLTETLEGDLAISYNKGNWSRHNRPRCARVSTAWIQEKRVVADLKDGRTGWHTIDPGPNRFAATERYILDDGQLWLEIEQNPGNKATTGIVRNVPLVADGKIELAIKVPQPDAYLVFGNSLLSPRNADEACLRVRFGNGKIFLGSGRETRAENNRRTTQYQYSSHKITNEIEYPRSYASNDLLKVQVRFHAKTSKAQVAINDAASVELDIDQIFGLTFVGLLVGNGGKFRFHSMTTELA